MKVGSSPCFSLDSFFPGTTVLCTKAVKSLKGGLPGKLEESGGFSHNLFLLTLRFCSTSGTFVASVLHQGDDTYCDESSQGPIRKSPGLFGKAGGPIDAMAPVIKWELTDTEPTFQNSPETECGAPLRPIPLWKFTSLARLHCETPRLRCGREEDKG